MIEELATETDAARQSQTFTRWLDTMGAFHQYSWGNVLLIGSQRPTATKVAGFRTWQKLSRFVRKGEKGIRILAPCFAKVTETVQRDGASLDVEGKRIYFRQVYVFDVAQTDGESLPKLPVGASGDVGNLIEKLEAFAASEGISIEYKPAEDMDGSYGYSKTKEPAIAIRQGMEPAHTASVLIHEITHQLLHSGLNRKAAIEKGVTQRELEAEASAFVVSGHFGVRTESAFYLASYQVDGKQLRASLETIQQIAKRLITACTDVLAEIPLIVADSRPDELAVAA